MLQRQTSRFTITKIQKKRRKLLGLLNVATGDKKTAKPKREKTQQSGVSRMKFSGFLPFPGAFLNFCKNYVAETLLERKKNRRICLRTLWKRSNRCFHV
jgi:hypothetical protein